MDEYLKLFEKGNMGEESALIDLGLQGNQEVSFIPHKSQPTMETLTAKYSCAKNVALVANILEVSLLENLSMFLDLVASLLYKTQISVEVDTS